MHDWPYPPAFRLPRGGAYVVTGATYKKVDRINTPGRLDFVRDYLFETALKHKWELQAWAIMGNHYHFVISAPRNPATLRPTMKEFHAHITEEFNHEDNEMGRTIWQKFWYNRLYFNGTFLSRVNYVHQNPLYHEVVKNPRQYKWCSASWFETRTTSEFKKRVYSYPLSRVNVRDDF